MKLPEFHKYIPEMRTNPKEGGFSLIETVTALVIFGALMFELGSMVGLEIRTDSNGRHIMAANSLAQEKMEEILSMDYDTVATGSDPGPLTEEGETTGKRLLFNRGWDVATGPVADTKIVTVAVAWTDSLHTQKRALKGIIVR